MQYLLSLWPKHDPKKSIRAKASLPEIIPIARKTKSTIHGPMYVCLMDGRVGRLGRWMDG